MFSGCDDESRVQRDGRVAHVDLVELRRVLRDEDVARVNIDLDVTKAHAQLVQHRKRVAYTYGVCVCHGINGSVEGKSSLRALPNLSRPYVSPGFGGVDTASPKYD